MGVEARPHLGMRREHRGKDSEAYIYERIRMTG